MAEARDMFESVVENQQDEATKQKLLTLHEKIQAHLSNAPLNNIGNSVMNQGGENKSVQMQDLLSAAYAKRMSGDIIMQHIAGTKNEKLSFFGKIGQKIADKFTDSLLKQNNSYDAVLANMQNVVVQQFKPELDELKQLVATENKQENTSNPTAGTDNQTNEVDDHGELEDEEDHTHETGNRSTTAALLTFLGGFKEAVEKNIVQVDFLGKKVNVHSYVVLPLKAAEAEIKKDPDASKYVITMLGGYNWRKKKNGNTMSNHAGGLAIDINWDKNPFNAGELTDAQKKQGRDIPDSFVAIMKKHGFAWGGDWKKPYDPMHFEYSNMQLLTEAKTKYSNYIAQHQNLNNVDQYANAA